MPDRHTRMTAVLFAAVLAAGPTSVAAQEKIGDVVATIDGESFEWNAYAAEPSGPDYNTAMRLIGPMQDVTVMGFPPGPVSMEETITITFMLMPGSPGTFEQDVIYAPEGMTRMWKSLDTEDLITIDTFETTETGGEVTGTISGRVCQMESMVSEPDPNTCKMIEGRFTSFLPKSEI